MGNTDIIESFAGECAKSPAFAADVRPKIYQAGRKSLSIPLIIIGKRD